MIAWLQKKYALSQQGAKDLVKGCFACLLQNLSFMVPVGLLFLFVRDLMAGGVTGGGRVAFYLAGCLVCLVLIFLTTWFQYNATYFATYVESGVRRENRKERDPVLEPAENTACLGGLDIDNFVFGGNKDEKTRNSGVTRGGYAVWHASDVSLC